MIYYLIKLIKIINFNLWKSTKNIRGLIKKKRKWGWLWGEPPGVKSLKKKNKVGFLGKLGSWRCWVRNRHFYVFKIYVFGLYLNGFVGFFIY